jgi:membrane protein required for colicin V production
MNPFDISLLVVAGVLVLLGLWKGLVRLLIGLGALVAAFILAARFHRPLAHQLAWSEIPDQAMMLIAYVLIFLGTMIAGGVVAYLMRKLLKVAMLSWADRAAGAALGLLVALLSAALLVLPVVAYSPASENLLQRSVLAPYVAVVADIASPLVPPRLAEQYHRRIEDLRQFWRDRWSNEA